MSAPMHALCLTLLAALSATAATASPTVSSLKSGEVQFTFSSDAVSPLSIDLEAMAKSQCGDDDGEAPGNFAECRLKVPPAALQSSGQFHTMIQTLEGAPTVHGQVSGLTFPDIGSIETPCGVWDISLKLDTTEPQPISPILLEPAADDPGHGIFASVLEMKVLLRLANQATGEAVEYPLGFGLGQAGKWSLASLDELSPGQSNLLLLASRSAGTFEVPDRCIPPQVRDDPERMKDLLARGYVICCRVTRPPDGTDEPY